MPVKASLYSLTQSVGLIYVKPPVWVDYRRAGALLQTQKGLGIN